MAASTAGRRPGHRPQGRAGLGDNTAMGPWLGMLGGCEGPWLGLQEEMVWVAKGDGLGLQRRTVH